MARIVSAQLLVQVYAWVTHKGLVAPDIAEFHPVERLLIFMCTYVHEANIAIDDTLKRSMESLYSECGEMLKRLPFHCLTGLRAHRRFGLLHLAMHIFEDKRAVLLFSHDVKTAIRIRNYRLGEDETMVTLYVQTSGDYWWQTTMTWYDVANAWGFKDHR
jgi:hypothetical protein